jgi:hypothetical protein
VLLLTDAGTAAAANVVKVRMLRCGLCDSDASTAGTAAAVDDIITLQIICSAGLCDGCVHAASKLPARLLMAWDASLCTAGLCAAAAGAGPAAVHDKIEMRVLGCVLAACMLQANCLRSC